ncbi:MAG: indole-3-glycerol-phosphate synthase TrpC [Syntrophus sp. (in: bacteria)]|nr:indole-3-glycerol-phosphate synthase TrpC [Syntrophus sp. (in: bacteria)]
MIDAIIETKKAEIKTLKGLRPGTRVKPLIPLCFEGPVNIIAELKQRSPSAGTIGEINDERIAAYSRYATAISVLTDSTYFGGSFELLEEVARKSPLPILCKDFIIDESQVDLAYGKGADVVLLIVRVLGKERLRELYTYSTGLGLACLVEIHKREELEAIADLHPEIVGVNARDLDTLAIDLDLAASILSELKAPVRIAESGVRSRRDIERFQGANGFLIGETLMKSKDLDALFRELLYG